MQSNLSEIPTQFQTVLRFPWVCFMVDVIGLTGVSTLISSISDTSSATTTYLDWSSSTTKLRPTKLPKTGASKGAMKAPPSCTKIYFLFFCNVLGFTSSQILMRLLLIYLFFWSLTLMIEYSQIALNMYGFKSAIVFSVLWKNNVTISTWADSSWCS